MRRNGTAGIIADVLRFSVDDQITQKSGDTTQTGNPVLQRFVEHPKDAQERARLSICLRTGK